MTNDKITFYVNKIRVIGQWNKKVTIFYYNACILQLHTSRLYNLILGDTYLLPTSTSELLSLQWRHNGLDGVSAHPPHDCLFNHLFRRRSKKTSKFRVAGNSPVTGEFPAQMASNAENVSIRWRHHDLALRLKMTVHCVPRNNQKMVG